MKQVVFDLRAVLAADPTRARDALRQLFNDGVVVLEPQDDGSYVAKSEVLPLMILPTTKSRKPQRLAEASDVYNVGCAGAQCTLDNAVEVPLHVDLMAQDRPDRQLRPEIP